MAGDDMSKYEYFLTSPKEQNHYLANWTSNGDSVGGENAKVNSGVVQRENGVCDDATKRQYKDTVSVRRRGRPKRKRMASALERSTRRKFLSKRKPHLRNPDRLGPDIGTSATTLLQQLCPQREQLVLIQMRQMKECFSSQARHLLHNGLHCKQPSLMRELRYA